MTINNNLQNNLATLTDSFFDLLLSLNKINTDLLKFSKTNSRKAFLDLIDVRLQISQQIETLVNSSSSLRGIKHKDMPDAIKDMLHKILKQDQELMIYFEMETQKAKYQYQRLYSSYLGRIKL